jgi:PAS domain S-box-containing protein
MTRKRNEISGKENGDAAADSGEGAASSESASPSPSVLKRRVTQARSDFSNEHRLQKALRTMEAFRDQAKEQHERLAVVENALEVSRDLYAELYDHAPIGYFTLDANGVIENVNRTAAAMLQRERSSIVGLPFLTLVAQPDWKKFLEHRRLAGTGRPISTELHVRGPNGESFPVQLSTRESLLPGMGQRRCYLTAMLDLSELRRNESERMRLATEEQRARLSSESKDRFLAMLSHELRTPLTPIMAALSDPELLRGVTSEPLSATLEMIRRNIAIEARLVQDLLDLSGMKQGKLRVEPAAMDLHQAIADAMVMIRPEAIDRGVEVAAELSAERHWINGDAVRMQQLMGNLLRNAVKFTPRGGNVRVRTINAGDQITVSVRDTGIGLAPQHLERLFIPFEQVSPETGAGLGLGLAICRGLVEAHHGTIRAHSEGAGTGSTFEVTLQTIDAPAHLQPNDSPTASNRPPQQKQNGRAAGLRIMLVEDHRDTANVMSRLLQSHGHQVEVAGSLNDAIALANEEFDLAISDITLPDGSGLDLMRLLKESGGGVSHGIALSGLASEDDVRRSREAGFQEHLAKPIDFQKLLAVIGQVTCEARAGTMPS